MKWLILLLLFACGKDQEPTAQDLGDADGDQIYNNLEVGKDKYIAQVEELPEIKGVLTFTQDRNSQRFIRLELINQRDIEGDAFKLLTHANASTLKEEHFSEWSRLRLKGSLDKYTLKESFYELTLFFEAPAVAPTSLLLKDLAGTRSLGPWKQNMKFVLTKEELSNLLEGRANLHFSSSWLEKRSFGEESQEQSVKRRTYRVFFHDGENSKVMYVSKDLEFSRLKEMLQLSNVLDMREQIDLMAQPEFVGDSWWSRDLDGDKVLLFASTEAVSKSFRDGLKLTESSIGRQNGKASAPVKFQKPQMARMFFVINADNVERIFEERKLRLQHTESRGKELGLVAFFCNYVLREVVKEIPRYWGWEELWDNIELRIDGKLLNWNEVFLSKQVESKSGPRMIMGLRTVGKEVSLKLKDRPTQTFITTGRIYNRREEASGWSYLTNCHPNQNILLNTEAKLRINIQAFVEKL